MTGFQSRVRDALQQATPSFAPATVVTRTLSKLIDPTMVGKTRFAQVSGFPFGVLTPQMTQPLEAVATAGGATALIQGTRLQPWLLPGVTIAFEGQEEATIVSSSIFDGDTRVILEENLVSSHPQSSPVSIRAFNIFVTEETHVGDGGIGQPAISVTSPFLLIPGDTITVAGMRRTLSEAEETETAGVYLIKVTDPAGLPIIQTNQAIRVEATLAYRSKIIRLPHVGLEPLIEGPIAIDAVAGPVVADYNPRPNVRIFLEQFNAASERIVGVRETPPNSTITRLPISSSQFLFWKSIEGGTNLNGNRFQLKAFASGRAHLWTPCRPALDPAPETVVRKVVPGFPPYAVFLLSRIVEGSIVVRAPDGSVLPDTEYTIDHVTGTVSFAAQWANTAMLISYRPRVSWQTRVTPSEDGLQYVVTVGKETKQVFNLGPANIAQTINIDVTTTNPVDQLHMTLRRASDAGGPCHVEVDDWVPRGVNTNSVRYYISTGAVQDYDWACSGLLVKALWPSLNILRAKLDGSSLTAKALDNGRLLL